ncbi:MAG: triose-phosphate isomerase [Alphaproteobacteria bacterium]
MSVASGRRPLIAGNWKMNGLAADGLELARAMRERVEATGAPDLELLLCPPATLVRAVSEALAGSGIAVGGQDCHAATGGAHTGDVSASMLADAGASYVILGHSERRQDHGETDALVRAKVIAAHGADLAALVCIGETEAERDGGQTLAVLSTQLEGSLPLVPPGGSAPFSSVNTVIAYEPVWAIGTGRTPTLEQVEEAHSHIRAYLSVLIRDDARRMRVLYGGSVKPDNAEALLGVADVDGALVGGASLKAQDFWAIAMSVPG